MSQRKKELAIPCLKTIKAILLEFDFLEYNTRKRNLAYQIQYLEFKKNLLKSYSIYGAIRSILLRELVIILTNITEYLLFVSLRQIYGKDPRSHKFPQLVGQARGKNLIGRTTARVLNEIAQLRNHLHPAKQKTELDIHCFTQKNVDFCLSAMNRLRKELSEYFEGRNIQVKTDSFRCPYEGYSNVLFDGGGCLYWRRQFINLRNYVLGIKRIRCLRSTV